MLSNAKFGNDSRLQLAFYEIERTMPIFGICINKRLASVIDRKWDIVPIDESEQAQSQAEMIRRIFNNARRRNKDGITKAIQHLAMSQFRGRAVVKPFYDEDNEQLIFKCLDNWNVLSWGNKLWWNPKAEDYERPEEGKLEEIPDGEVMCLEAERPIDIPGMTIYLRQLIGEEQWARFIEKQGIPQVVLRVDGTVPADRLDDFEARAVGIMEGGSGVLPDSCEIQQLTSARSQDPFTSFCTHQMKMICILACGSTGTVLGDVGGGIGSDLVAQQEKQFQTLVSQQCEEIANVFNDITVRKICEVKGIVPLCEFKFVEDE